MRKISVLTVALLCLSVCTAWAQDARTTRLTLDSEVMGEQRAVLVNVPNSYARGNGAYPVLYLTDGDAQIAHTVATMDFLARSGRMPEMIIVGISNTDRTRDLTPTRAGMRNPQGNVVPLPTSGGASRFLEFIETELIPHVEQRYRTVPMRVLAGHSFGGLFAVHVLVTRPGLFYGYIAASPTLHWDNEYPLKRMEEFLRAHPQHKGALYVTLGDEGGEMETSFTRLEQLLKKRAPRSLAWSLRLMKDEDHGSVVLPTHYAGFRLIYDGWRLPVNGNADVAGALAGAESHYRKLSERYGYEVRVPENVANRIGYQLLQAGKTDEAIATFQRNVEWYPRSANVYDSLAEAYEKSGHSDLARANYQKAVDLGTEAADPNLAIYRANLERVAAVVAAEKD